MKVEGRFPRPLQILFMLVILSVSGCVEYDQRESFDLVDEFGLARTAQLVQGVGAVGGYPFRPFLGVGLLPSKGGRSATCVGRERARAFGFFLYRTEPVVVVLQGKTASGRRRKVFLDVNGQGRQGCELSPEWTRVELEIPASRLVPGMNWISLEEANDTIWQSCEVSSRGAPRDAERKPVQPGVLLEPKKLLIPFGGSVEYAVVCSGRSRLSFILAPWTEPGAAQLDPNSVLLEVRIASPKLEHDLVLSFEELGQVRAKLPAALDNASLFLRATLRGDAKPRPGQLGLTLEEPVLQREAFEPPPAPIVTRRPRAARGKRSNVLVFLVDTLRADRLASYGYPYPTSPRLDEILPDSVIFTDAGAQSPWTKPSVASLLTSLEPDHHGVLDFGDRLPDDVLTLAEILKGEEYQTGGFTANPLVGPRFDFGQGFDTYELLPGDAKASVVARKGIAWLEKRDPARPFLLYLHTLEPHSPYNPPPPYRQAWLDRHGVKHDIGTDRVLLDTGDERGFSKLKGYLYARLIRGLPANVPKATRDLVDALYDGEVAANDDAFGKVVDWLKAHEMYEDTILVFVSDHGEEIFDHGDIGHVHSMKQDLLRMPLVVKFPRSEHGGRRVADLWQQIDVLPTILDAVGVSRPATVEGSGFPANVLRVKARPAFAGVSAGLDARAHGQGFDYFEEARTVRSGSWKFTSYLSSVKPQDPVSLYDLRRSPDESQNVVLSYPVQALHLETLARSHAHLGRQHRKAEKADPQETRDLLRSLQYLR